MTLSPGVSFRSLETIKERHHYKGFFEENISRETGCGASGVDKKVSEHARGLSCFRLLASV